MIIQFKDLKEGTTQIYNILNQGDSRYNSPEDELWLADFIMHDAIILEEREIPLVEINKEEGISRQEVQGEHKRIAKQLLKLEGYRDDEILFEIAFRGSRPDVYANNPKKRIVVECCSCRINKIIDFLEEVDEIWILTHGYLPWEELSKRGKNWKMQWFVFKKGSKWGEIYNRFQQEKIKELKKIKSPIDIL